MRATINIECTPAEARAFFGLPDLQPIQAAVIGQMQKRMLSAIDRFSPEALMGQWLSAFPQNVERMQEMFANPFLGGAGQARSQGGKRQLIFSERSCVLARRPLAGPDRPGSASGL